tara:strand:+ start:108 stop:473 length:366 start_codon:yes stop_codon:yes gene_type:complete
VTGASPASVFATDLKVQMTPTTVDIRTSSTLNNYGERTFTGDATTYPAYVRKSTRAERDISTETDQCDYIAYIPDQTLSLNVDDQITLPAPISGTRPIVRVDHKSNALGQVGLVVYLGRAR